MEGSVADSNVPPQANNQVNGTSEGEQPFDVIPGTNLYVKNLGDNVDDAWLMETFRAFGTITSAKIMRNEAGASRGFGFVCFSTPEEAAGAKQELNGKMFGTKPLYVNVAMKKEERRAYLSEQYSKPYYERYNNDNSDKVAEVNPEQRFTPVLKTVTPQASTPPRTHGSPLQILGKHTAPYGQPTIAPATQPATQQVVGGMNGFVLVRPAVGQPVTAPPGYIFAPASTMPQPTVHCVYNQIAHWPTYPAVGTQQAQSFVGIRHAPINLAPANPAAPPVMLNPAKLHHMVIGQHNQNVYPHVPLPVPVAQPSTLNSFPSLAVHQVPGVGIAAYSQPHSHSHWANGFTE